MRLGFPGELSGTRKAAGFPAAFGEFFDVRSVYVDCLKALRVVRLDDLECLADHAHASAACHMATAAGTATRATTLTVAVIDAVGANVVRLMVIVYRRRAGGPRP